MSLRSISYLLCILLIVACKNETTGNAKKRYKAKSQKPAVKDERADNRTFGSKDLIAPEGRRSGNVLHLPPKENTKSYHDSYRIIYESMFTKADKPGQTTSMTAFTFNQSGTEIREHNADELKGLALALKDNPNVKIQILSHSNVALGITHARANAVKQSLIALGAPADQVSSMGKGRANAAKAAGNMISVKVLGI